MIRTVEIFGKGCKNCERLEENVVKAGNELGFKLQIVKIKDQDEITERGVFRTPGLAVDGKIVSTGKVLSPNKIKELIA